jgi:hypothetical protein
MKSFDALNSRTDIDANRNENLINVEEFGKHML